MLVCIDIYQNHFCLFKVIVMAACKDAISFDALFNALELEKAHFYVRYNPEHCRAYGSSAYEAFLCKFQNFFFKHVLRFWEYNSTRLHKCY